MKTYLLIISLAICSTTFAQFRTLPTTSVAVEPQRYFKTVDGGYIELRKTIKENHRYNLNKITYNVTLVKYDKNLAVVKAQEVPGMENGMSMYFFSMVRSGGKTWFIYIEPLKPQNKSEMGNIIAKEIDEATLQAGKNVIIANQSDMKINVEGYFPYQLKIMFESSQDKKHHAVLIGYEKDEFYLSNLNENFETVFKSKQKIENYKLIEIRSIYPDNDGNTIVFSRNLKKGGTITKFSPTGSLTSTVCPPNPETVFTAKFYNDPKTNALMVVGTCKSNSDFVTGVFKSVVNKENMSLDKMAITPIPDDMIKKLSEAKFARQSSKKSGIYDAYFTNWLVSNNDNNLHLMIECNDEPANGSYYVYGYVIDAIFNTTDKANLSLIRKYEMALFDRYVNTPYERLTRDKEPHFLQLFCKDKLVIAYYDNQENVGKSVEEKEASLQFGKNAVLMVAFISPDGSIKKKLLPVNDALGLWQSVYKFSEEDCGQ